MSIPRATARLQFHKDFTLDDAAGVVDYYAGLGVTHLYASPILTARPGSMHGYDVVDPTRLNPEVGGEPALRRLVARLREAGMGLIADIVPNHMGVGPDNPWWQDVFEWGPDSRYAGWFDIEWHSTDPALEGKILAPFLGQPYGDALRAGEIRLEFDKASGKLFACYFNHRFPLAPSTYAMVLRDDVEISDALSRFSAETADGVEALHRLLERQHYRLTWWRNAAEEINWRRFFEVSDLAGVRVEKDEVFEATHALIFRLYAEGLIDGVRIDHVDGLANPGAYCRRLRQRLEELAPGRPAGAPQTAPYIIVEKILAAGEQLRPDWGVDGSTGYEFMDQVGALLHDPAGAEPLTTLWTELTGGPGDFESEVRAARRQLLAQNFVGELDAAARSLLALARADLHTRDFSLASIRRVLTELLVHFPVYRTYAGTGGRDPLDEQVFERAASEARACLRNADQPMLEVIGGWLGGNAPRSEMRELYLRAITRFQQLTPPLAAKSVEDTAFYRYGRLLSRNEVGADPGQFSLGIEAFHQLCGERAQRFPNNLLATATHDHKRGEDTRARLAILSEIPLQWGQTVRRWMALNGPLGAPRPYDELMLYQALVGAWPLELTETDQEGLRALVERIAQWQTKALREAKRASDWALPDEAYETACREFLFRIFDPDTNAVFIKELAAWVRRIAPAGAINSLSQTVLRLTTPGVPDLYQGTELWDFSLVDPDNRRPVDHGLRREMLARKTPSIDSLAGWQNGWIKQAIIHHGLALRAREPELFSGGDYIPLAVEGARSANVIAFLRRHQDHAAITVATRFPAGITDIANLAIDETSAEPSVPESAWEDTMLILPDSAQLAWRDCFTGKRIQADAGRLRLTDVFCLLPVALLHALN